ncbi:MAG: hypothetical protein JWP58_4588, partial [Hymenobacter sp.]|nr:hypothetical protein [Hymenobacter sp.]
MTTRRNIRAHKNGISTSKLPLTFQHAVEIARHLRIRYLWIDSLCIIQKDSDDWERESGRMADIYRNSYITIAATSSSGPHEGFLSVNERTTFQTVNFQMIHHFNNSAAYQNSLHGRSIAPLITRAWAYQERMPAPRVLHFALNEVVYDCFQEKRCECNGTYRGVIDMVEKREVYDTLISPVKTEYPDTAMMWRKIVIEYSRRKLTFSSDKLPALAGLADQMRQTTHQKYLAGLWEHSLIFDLLWYRANDWEKFESDPNPSSDPSDPTWRAPSWSWVSINRPVDYDQKLFLDYNADYQPKERCTFVEAETTSGSHTATGQVVAGFIKLRCSVVHAVYHKNGSIKQGKKLLNFNDDGRGTEPGDGIHLLLLAEGEKYSREEEIILVVKEVDTNPK